MLNIQFNQQNVVVKVSDKKIEIILIINKIINLSLIYIFLVSLKHSSVSTKIYVSPHVQIMADI